MRAPSGLAANVGVVAVTRNAPPDLAPRIGSGGNATFSMRARSDLDDEGVIRFLFPGSAWVHGSLEFLRPVADFDAVGVGVAAFVDAVRVVGGGSTPRGAVHLGGGARLRVLGVPGWLRMDWAVDPSSGAHAISAAWVGR
jgi:hypothetical protein